jgi:hypothetical protein
VSHDQQRAARDQRRRGPGQDLTAQFGAHLEVGDEHEVEGRAGRLVLAQIGDHPVHLAVRDAVGGAQLAPLFQADPGEVDRSHRPAAFGQPDRVAALSGGEVERPARRQPAQLLRHELVRVHRPLELRTGVPVIPLLPVHPATVNQAASPQRCLGGFAAG